jgi:methyl-accepting chemotaxis protein
MALVKKSKIAAATAKPAAPSTLPAANPKHRPSRASASKQTVFDRVAAATEELASGLTEAASATKELGRSMAQIAAGAEEAAGASQEQSAAIKRIVASFGAARTEAEKSGRRSEALIVTLAEATTQIVASVRSIERNAERQLASVAIINELELKAKDIGEITQTVSRISDRTNLLALNAAIEAARAGEHGRGFAVVADEVRALAETSDKNAREVQDLASSMGGEVQRIVDALRKAAETAAKDSKSAANVVNELQARRDDAEKVAAGNAEILTAAAEAERAAVEAGTGAEQIASAAEEQSAGASEAQSAVQQQAKSLDQAQMAAQALAVLAEDLRRGKEGISAADQIGASAEELSATVQELSSAANQVMAAVEQIDRACKLQASATQETSAALAQIEKSARLAEANVRTADERVQTLDAALKSGRDSVERLVAGVSAGLGDMQTSVSTVSRLGGVGRKIEKIVDAIALIAVQTSMLAVSGSVEAARAGDSGRGFAIVSNDIRSLAREASANVERAKDTVRGVLDQIAILKNELEQIVASSEIEVSNNRTVSALLAKVVGDIDEMRVGNKAIVRGAAEILAATVETATGARQVAVASEEASAAARQAATAATQQARGAEDLAAAIEEIASLADELKLANA